MSRRSSTLLLVDGLHLSTRRARLRDRLLARWCALELDRALADGTSPETSPALTIRARGLNGPIIRRNLAKQILRIAHEPSTSTTVRLRHRHTKEARDELERLARRLLAPTPVATRGVARSRLLLTDGAGPLYWCGTAADLRSAVEEALEGLELPQ